MNSQFPIMIILCLVCIFACEIENELPTDEIRQAPKISILAATTTEQDENNSIEFTVELSWDYPQEVQVDYQTIAGTAEAETDYVETAGTLVFVAGETSKIVSITVLGENIFENDETLELELSNPVNASILLGKAVGTIKNDDDVNELVIPSTGYSTPRSYPDLELVWEDEFDGEALNPDNWVYETGTGNSGWGNNELQFYRTENTSLQDGHLIIEAKQESFGGQNYTSSRIKTQTKQNFRFGRVDIRAVLPQGQGLWPALWMLGSKINAVGWPACGEIDIMELIGHQPGRVYGTAHFGVNPENHQFTGRSTNLPEQQKFAEEFHVFSIIWTENKIEWYMDDQLYFEFDNTSVGGQPYPFNDSFFFIFNVAVGGNFPGSPDETTVFPQRMIVDYVRVFQ